MKRFLFLLILTPFTCGAYNWWPEQDMPETGLPPVPSQIYTPPLNPLRRTIREVSCPKAYSAIKEDGVSRKDIIKHNKNRRTSCYRQCSTD